MKWCSLLALVALAAPARAQGTRTPVAKTDSPPRVAGPSTLNGVYTTEQAVRGKDVYAGNCRSCHTPASHTGEMFATWWQGKHLSDLFTFVSTQMPKNDPGSLSADEAADVVAYLLQINGMPPGKTELYPDADSLKRFQIETRSADSTAGRKKP
jgi:mono/diheme cytochrome c family protein